MVAKAKTIDTDAPSSVSASYDGDVVAWSIEQARLLRVGRFDLLDVEHIADEIEDVGKSEARELSSRMAVLLMHYLKWQFQPDLRTHSWYNTAVLQRRMIERRLKRTPSLRPLLSDAEWLADVWDDALIQAVKETALPLETFPAICPWQLAEMMLHGWMPREVSL